MNSERIIKICLYILLVLYSIIWYLRISITNRRNDYLYKVTLQKLIHVLCFFYAASKLLTFVDTISINYDDEANFISLFIFVQIIIAQLIKFIKIYSISQKTNYNVEKIILLMDLIVLLLAVAFKQNCNAYGFFLLLLPIFYCIYYYKIHTTLNYIPVHYQIIQKRKLLLLFITIITSTFTFLRGIDLLLLQDKYDLLELLPIVSILFYHHKMPPKRIISKAQFNKKVVFENQTAAHDDEIIEIKNLN